MELICFASKVKSTTVTRATNAVAFKSSTVKFAAANLTVELLKATALVALVTVVDLTFEAKQINSITWLSAQCFGTALLIYYMISRFFLVPFLRWLEVLAARKVGKEIK